MGELKVKTGIDGAGWTRGLEQMQEQAGAFGKSLNSKVAGNFNQAIMSVVPGLTGAIAAIFSASAIKESLSAFAERGQQIEFGAIRLNVDQETFQRLDRVMKVTGQDAETVATAFDKLAVGLTKIESGHDITGELRQAFAELGVSADEIAKKDYQKIFFQIAAGMKDITPTKEQIAALREVFGKQGDNLLPAMKLGFESDYATRGVLSDKDLTAIKNYNEEMRNQASLWAPMLRGAKSFSLAVLAGWSRLANPFAWARAAGTPEEDGYHKKFMADEEARLDKIAANKRKAAALQDTLHKDNEKLDKEDAKKASEIDKETHAQMERNRYAGLAPEAKRLELLKQIRQAEGELAYGGDPQGGKVGEAQLRKHIQELRHELLETKDEPKKEKAAMSHMGNQAIGGILLGHDTFKEMAAHTRVMAHNTAVIAKNTAPPPGGRGGSAPPGRYH